MSTNKRDERIGEINKNNLGIPMKIIEYKNATNITVEFQDEYNARVHTSYQMFKKGEVKNPYDKTIYGVGYIGVGKYKTKGKDGKNTQVYKTWQDMLKRCYDAYYINKYPTYIDCFVCDEWLCFQNFAEWYYKNYYEVEGQRMELDKDILIKGNKIYSPETCVFVPHRINSLFVKRDTERGEYPIGVCHHKAYGKLMVQCNVFENEKRKQKYLGYFPLDRPFQAFCTYKQFKENYVKQVAEEYKHLIPNKLYEAMYKYKVEIND